MNKGIEEIRRVLAWAENELRTSWDDDLTPESDFSPFNRANEQLDIMEVKLNEAKQKETN